MRSNQTPIYPPPALLAAYDAMLQEQAALAPLEDTPSRSEAIVALMRDAVKRHERRKERAARSS